MEACFRHKIESEKKWNLAFYSWIVGLFLKIQIFFGILLFLNINWE